MQKQFSYQLYIAFALSIMCTIAAVIMQRPLLLALPIVAVVAYVIVPHFNALWLLLIATIAFSTETAVTDSLSLDLPDEPLMMLVTGIVLLLLMAKQIILPNGFWKDGSIQLLVAISLWSLISASCSSYPVLSLKYCLAKLWFLVPFVIVPQLVTQRSIELKHIAMALVGAVGVTVLYVIYQHSTRSFLFHMINNSVLPFYRNHVNYAALVVCCLPVIYYLRKNATNEKHKKWLLAIAAVFLFAIATSYSRGAWLAMITAIAAVWLVKRKWLSYAFIVTILASGALVFWLSQQNRYLHYHGNYRTVIYHSNFKDHWTATFTGKDLSNAERFNRWVAGVHMVNQNGFTGFGPNTFYNNYKPYIVTPFKTWVSENKERSTVHNYFLLTLIEQGWVGFGLLLTFTIGLFRSLETIYRKAKQPWQQHTALCITAILAMILTLNFLSDLIETDKIGSLFYLCIGLTVWLRSQVFAAKQA